ncbi:hypothetical protein EON63_10985 [archaeon]|nr:MAG: hypothetical protein EON63_10985 [archaeon]
MCMVMYGWVLECICTLVCMYVYSSVQVQHVCLYHVMKEYQCMHLSFHYTLIHHIHFRLSLQSHLQDVQRS